MDSSILMADAPVSTPVAGLSAQIERMIMEQLPLNGAAEFHEWLVWVEGNWTEYCRDYLDPWYREALYDATTGLAKAGTVPSDPEPDKATTVSRATKAINDDRSIQFLAYHPPQQVKQDWSDEDHAVRFLVTVVQDSLLHKAWGRITYVHTTYVATARAAYEMLSFKRAAYIEVQRKQWEKQWMKQLEENKRTEDSLVGDCDDTEAA